MGFLEVLRSKVFFSHIDLFNCAPLGYSAERALMERGGEAYSARCLAHKPVALTRREGRQSKAHNEYFALWNCKDYFRCHNAGQLRTQAMPKCFDPDKKGTAQV